MLELKRGQRAVLVEKVPDVANLAVGALVFEQVLSERPFSWWLVLAGTGMWILLVGLIVVLAELERP